MEYTEEQWEMAHQMVREIFAGNANKGCSVEVIKNWLEQTCPESVTLTGGDIWNQVNHATYLNEVEKDFIDQRMKNGEHRDDLLIRFKGAYESILRRDFGDLPDSIVVLAMVLLDGAQWYIKHGNETLEDIIRENLPSEEEQMEMLTKPYEEWSWNNK